MIFDRRGCLLKKVGRRERPIASRPEDFPQVLRDLAVCLNSLNATRIVRGYGDLFVALHDVQLAIEGAVEDLDLIADVLERRGGAA